jgi:3',5'-cyclic AMP phosphodiesterase CpdA
MACPPEHAGWRKKNMAVIATFLHISDLHIGEIDPATGNAKVPPGAAAVVRNWPGTFADGLLGHQGRSLLELMHFYRDLRKNGRTPTEVLVTGDYTRYGAIADFDLAFSYLEDEINVYPKVGRYAGLRLRKRPPGIPGNHDHWAGNTFPVTKSPSLYWPYPGVTKLPAVLKRIRLAPSRELVICGIDSDAAIPSDSVARLLAQGSFQQQLSDLEQILGRNVNRELRVLMIHHSWKKRGVLLSMDAGSRSVLERFLQDCDIKVVLTGHTHRQTMTLIGSTGAHELCCGTTTQIDQVPYSWRNILRHWPGQPGSWPRNTLMMHRVHEDPVGKRWEWETEVFVRDNRNGFEPLRRGLRYRFPV